MPLDLKAEVALLEQHRGAVAAEKRIAQARLEPVPARGERAGYIEQSIRARAFDDPAGLRIHQGGSLRADARIQAIVKTWPANFRAPRALSMGFKPDADIESVIRDYIADEKISL